jgi:hypothetical protein
MANPPTLYVLRDLTPASKQNGLEAILASGTPVDNFLYCSIEDVASGHLELEHALWLVLQEPWMGLDHSSWQLAQEMHLEAFLLRHRDSLSKALREHNSILALACPALVEEAAATGFQIRHVAPSHTQILGFSTQELAHHTASLFPSTPFLRGKSAGARRNLPPISSLRVRDFLEAPAPFHE